MNSTIVKINKDGKVFINDKEVEYDNIIRVSINKIENDTK